jgi:signal transduction histidine kinase
MKRAKRLYALGQLSAGLAHEIRNSLASTEGAADVLQHETQSEERRRLNRLLTRFLDFAKPRQPDWRGVEVDNLLASVMVLARHAGGTPQLEMRKDVQPGLSTLECDPEQLKQVLLNLVMNAIQAMPRGGMKPRRPSRWKTKGEESTMVIMTAYLIRSLPLKRRAPVSDYPWHTRSSVSTGVR